MRFRWIHSRVTHTFRVITDLEFVDDTTDSTMDKIACVPHRISLVFEDGQLTSLMMAGTTPDGGYGTVVIDHPRRLPDEQRSLINDLLAEVTKQTPTVNVAPNYKSSAQEKEIDHGMEGRGEPATEAHEGRERPGPGDRGQQVRPAQSAEPASEAPAQGLTGQ